MAKMRREMNLIVEIRKKDIPCEVIRIFYFQRPFSGSEPELGSFTIEIH